MISKISGKCAVSVDLCLHKENAANVVLVTAVNNSCHLDVNQVDLHVCRLSKCCQMEAKSTNHKKKANE